VVRPRCLCLNYFQCWLSLNCKCFQVWPNRSRSFSFHIRPRFSNCEIGVNPAENLRIFY